MDAPTPVIVRIETESGACLRRLRVAGEFVDVRIIGEAIREELKRVQDLEKNRAA